MSNSNSEAPPIDACSPTANVKGLERFIPEYEQFYMDELAKAIFADQEHAEPLLPLIVGRLVGHYIPFDRWLRGEEPSGEQVEQAVNACMHVLQTLVHTKCVGSTLTAKYALFNNDFDAFAEHLLDETLRILQSENPENVDFSYGLWKDISRCVPIFRFAPLDLTHSPEDRTLAVENYKLQFDHSANLIAELLKMGLESFQYDPTMLDKLGVVIEFALIQSATFTHYLKKRLPPHADADFTIRAVMYLTSEEMLHAPAEVDILFDKCRSLYNTNIF